MEETTTQQAGTEISASHSSMTGAWFLIGIGAFLLLNNVFGLDGEVFLLIIGGVFLALYLNSRIYGWLVPAMILIGLGLGTLFEDAYWMPYWMEWTVLFLGLGFIAIYVVDRTVRGTSNAWPIWPGGILILIALVDTLDRYDFMWGIRGVIEDWWPLLLIVWGLALLRKGWGPDRTSSTLGPGQAA